MRLLIALVVWVAAVAGAAELSTVVAKAVHSKQAAGLGDASFDASSVQSTDRISLFHTASLSRALHLARAHIGPNAKLQSVVIYPGYLSLTAVRPAGETDVYVDANGRYDATATSGSPGSSPLFALSHVKANDPARLAQRIAAAAHTPLSQLHYMIFELDSDTRRPHWLIYTRQGNPITYFQVAGARGRLLQLGNNGLKPVRG